MYLYGCLFPKKGHQYLQGKRDLFGLIVAFRYLLPPQDFTEIKDLLTETITHYHLQSSHISQNSLLGMMGFPVNWETITDYPL